MIIDLVDRLSTPIQFMSLAEKRTKQMKGMGFDETDISDEALTSSSSSSVKQQVNVKQDQVPVLAASATTNDKATTTSQPHATAPATTSQQLVVTTDKKDKKGNIKLLISQVIKCETVLISL